MKQDVNNTSKYLMDIHTPTGYVSVSSVENYDEDDAEAEDEDPNDDDDYEYEGPDEDDDDDDDDDDDGDQDYLYDPVEEQYWKDVEAAKDEAFANRNPDDYE